MPKYNILYSLIPITVTIDVLRYFGALDFAPHSAVFSLNILTVGSLLVAWGNSRYRALLITHNVAIHITNAILLFLMFYGGDDDRSCALLPSVALFAPFFFHWWATAPRY